ncbi:MAG: nucleotide sugar dehydrogenase [candidate division Zixibacteria bacterium]|nr:nucleotide sugar dehydrogenase [candidate division Zixibacteria bacterium]
MATTSRSRSTTKTGSKQSPADQLIARIRSREAVPGIVGLGYVGLPLAMVLAEAGFKVLGLDISKEKIKLLNAGKSDIDDIPDSVVKKAVAAGRFKATDDPGMIAKVDTISICVPTPLSKTKDPDVSYILDAVNAAKPFIKKGTLVVLESTTYPGTTEELILPILETNGMKVGRDFFLAFSPERVDPGNPIYTTKNTPRVVGGVTPACTAVAKVFYEQTIPNVYPVTSTKAAEMVKLLENTFRSVNIGLVNEVALMCDRLGLNVWEIIGAASSKPFGFMPFYPGPGLGGHCIPIDPHYLSWKLKSLNYYARFIELAGDVNSHMPEYVVERTVRLLNERSGLALSRANIVVLGVAYKKDIKDVRESPALDVIKLLQNRGAKVSYNDPFVPSFYLEHGEKGEKSHGLMKSVKVTPELIKNADLVIIITDHSAYDYQAIVDQAKLVFDTRNATKKVTKNRNKITVL